MAVWNQEISNLGSILKMFASILYGGLPKTSHEAAIENLQKAIEIRPDKVIHRIQLGIVYEEVKEWQLAKEQYEKALELPVLDSDDPDRKELAKERLAIDLTKIK